MQIDRGDLDAAVSRRIVDADQAAALWRFFGERHPARARFTGLNVAYFFGALVVIGAMGWLMTLGFQRMGPWAVCATAVAYGAAFRVAGDRVWHSGDLRIPGGLVYAMAVCMTPLAIWGLETATGFWAAGNPGNYRDFYPFIRGSWIWMEAGTVVVALLALRRVKFPFLVAPAAVALWFMSMDFAAYLARDRHWQLALGQRLSITAGLAMLFAAQLADHRPREDVAFRPSTRGCSPGCRSGSASCCRARVSPRAIFSTCRTPRRSSSPACPPAPSAAGAAADGTARPARLRGAPRWPAARRARPGRSVS